MSLDTDLFWAAVVSFCPFSAVEAFLRPDFVEEILRFLGLIGGLVQRTAICPRSLQL